MARKKWTGKVSKNAEKAQQQGSKFGHLHVPKGVQVFQHPTSGRIYIDILPYIVSDPKHPDRDDETGIAVPGEEWYKRPYLLHRNIGSESESVVCPRTAKRNCPICEFRQLKIKEGADYQDEEVKALKATLRNLYAIIPIGMKEYSEDEIHVWDISDYLFQQALNEEISEDDEYESFPDPEEGYRLKIRLTEKQFGSNKFAEVSRIDFEERDEQYHSYIIKEVPDLDQMIEIPSYQKLEKMFYDMDDEPEPETEVRDPDEAEEEEEEDTKPRRKKKSARSGSDKPKRETKPDDGEAKSSGRRRRSRRAAKSEEDESDDEDDSDDDSSRAGGVAHDSGWTSRSDDGEEQYECPYGYRFGVDTDKYEECDDCPIWEACIDAKEASEEVS